MVIYKIVYLCCLAVSIYDFIIITWRKFYFVVLWSYLDKTVSLSRCMSHDEEGTRLEKWKNGENGIRVFLMQQIFSTTHSSSSMNV